MDYNDLTFTNGQIQVANPSKSVFKTNFTDSIKDVEQQSQKPRIQQQQQQRERQEIIQYEPDILFSIDDMLLQNQQTSDDKIQAAALNTPLVDPTQFASFDNDFIINDDFNNNSKSN